MSENKGILKAEDLAGYIKNEYKKKYKIEISPIKLQKVLYLLFAYWGGYVRNAKAEFLVEDNSLKNYSEYLYDDKIEAWTYGPVIRDVYNKYANNKLEDKSAEEVFKDDKYLESNIRGLMLELFELSDFKLVGLSHLDECWKKNYDITDQRHGNEISKEDIINEYAHKVLQ